MSEKLDELINLVKEYSPNADFALIEKAYNYAKNAHYFQQRASGEPYIVHCYNTAKILTELKLDEATICAALLHDVLEDTLVAPEELKEEFGEEITTLVEGVTKINSYKFSDNITAQAENWRKMLLAVVKDTRVIIIKLADRLHNMRTIRYLSPDKQKEISLETLTLYTPFAHRLGIYKWKSELEDLIFEVLQPAKYKEIRSKWEARSESNLKNLELIQDQIKDTVEKMKVSYRILARPKNLYGIYKKMQRQEKPFSAIQDLFGMRIITDTQENCYAILSQIQTNFKILEGSFTDYIAVPKANMYQSLHITVVSDTGVIVEIQIRTEEMHRRAEYGIAAHWRYKAAFEKNAAANLKQTDINMEHHLEFIKHILESQKDVHDSNEFLTAIKTECNFDQIYVSTPKGDAIKLPDGATALDFAYAVHSDIGDKCMGVKVDGKLVPLDYKLKTGQKCEVLVRKNINPTENWLKIVITAQAKSRIRKYLREHNKKK
ncbi:MAG: bifunctional (p)ppGpp synthetase/guanosine-3',5'-bis(diphosphate) 3'-pyrophosphohydrolase [Elusimicrobia bacterium]|nr:bifunctional (p)ppGpp synthetase/guanosine-3',5'-bis(diphosphate) 3'-pyrophosphohydrolase [Elusimicrobiota bacterium]